MTARGLPISQRHRPQCRRPRDCDCPWTGRVTAADGTKRRITGASFAEAEQKFYEAKAARPDPLPDKKTTVAQWAARYEAAGVTLRGQPWSLNSRLNVAGAIRNWIVPGIGHFKVTELRRHDVKLWAERMREAGAGETVIDKVMKIAHAMFEAWLADDRVLPRGNPVPPGLAIKKPWAEPWSPAPAQVEAWQAQMYPELQACFAFEVFYGGRMGEVIALKEADIRFDGKDVNAPIGPQLARLAALPEAEYKARHPRVRFERKIGPDRKEGPMKNKRGYRTQPLPRYLAAMLAEHVTRWPPAPDGWLFVGRRPARGRHAAQGISLRPIEPTYYSRLVRQAAERAGIERGYYKSSHALRNFCVTQLRLKGWNDRQIGEWIGDAGQTVEGYYGAKDPAVVAGMAADMEAAVTGDGPRLRAV